jgi:hypothetical protein
MRQNLVLGSSMLIIGLLLGGVGVYHYKPRTVTKTEVVTQQVVQNHIVTVVKTVIAPNGLKTETETITDNTVHTEKEDEVKIKEPLWHVSAGVQTGLQFIPSYSLQVERRIVGPLFIGARGATDGVVGFTLGLEF